MTSKRTPYTDIVLTHWAASKTSNTTTSEVIDKYHTLYGQQKQFTVEAVNENDPRICWGSLPERTPPTKEETKSSEAFEHMMNPQVRYGELTVGESFRFPGSRIVHVKTKSGYKTPENNHTWNTGKKVAVIPIKNR